MTGRQGRREPEGLIIVSHWWHGSDLSCSEWVASIAFACQTPGHQITRWLLRPFKMFYRSCICPCSFYICKSVEFRWVIMGGNASQALWCWVHAMPALARRSGLVRQPQLFWFLEHPDRLSCSPRCSGAKPGLLSSRLCGWKDEMTPMEACCPSLQMHVCCLFIFLPLPVVFEEELLGCRSRNCFGMSAKGALW